MMNSELANLKAEFGEIRKELEIALAAVARAGVPKDRAPTLTALEAMDAVRVVLEKGHEPCERMIELLASGDVGEDDTEEICAAYRELSAVIQKTVDIQEAIKRWNEATGPQKTVGGRLLAGQSRKRARTKHRFGNYGRPILRPRK